ncbi:NeuD/PglB/VioB family sugar acetyltransferase [Dickeya chrysanthemi]|uniref:NeuD/PglB/VioB family sugar acetyltransferase n=1 Tax=Dickeya chrysanthemi TaxID=556 RepID=UPI0030186168
MSKKIEGVLFYGFGGHARSVADVALANGIQSLLFVDDNARQGESFAGFPVVKDLPEQLPQGWIAFPAAGQGVKRKVQLENIKKRKWITGNIISSTATVGVLSCLGEACFIGHHAHVGPKTIIGDACIVNTGAVIEHDCSIGNYTHVSVNSTIAGGCTIGDFCFIGAASTIIDGISVGDNIVLGAGGCFIKNIIQSGTYVGVPANRLS